MQGGLVIGLFPNDNASLSTPNITSEPEPEPISKLSARNSMSFLLLFLIYMNRLFFMS